MKHDIITAEIAPGVQSCYIHSNRFKTSRISVCAYLPLESESVSKYSMLTLLMSSGCAEYPTPRELNSRLDTLYGASIDFDCTKTADTLMIVASTVFVDDKFLPEPVFANCADVLFKLLFAPAIDSEGFLDANFKREKRIQLEYIENEISDKRTYSRNRCVELMCDDEPYGLSVLGKKSRVEALTRGELLDAWKEMLRTAYFRVSVTAMDSHPEVADAFIKALNTVENRSPLMPKAPVYRDARNEIQTVEEHFPVAQGKLVMGFRTDMRGGDADSYKMMVFCDMFGGGPYSKLFSVVREKMSLCYYCAARAVRAKGILLVDSGVEFANMDRTYTAVLEQLEAMQRGDFDDSALEASKLALIGSLKGVYDSLAVLDRWYADRIFDPAPFSPADMEKLIVSVTRDDITEAARGVRLDTVYRLLGKEEQK